MATSRKKTAAKKTAPKKAAKKTAPKKAAPKKAAPKKAAPKRAAAKKAAPKKAAPKKAAPKKAAPKKAAPKKAAPKKAAPRRRAISPDAALPTGEMLTMEAEIPAPPEALYDAWLDAAQHGAMTGAAATSQAKVGGRFTAWDGYIEGEYLALFPKERIVARWRTSEFGAKDEDSQLDLLFSPHRVDGKAGTRLFLIHTNLPPGGASKYAAGWAEFYFAPMSAHFEA